MKALLGVELPVVEVMEAYRRLQFAPVLKGEVIECTVSSARLDINIEPDLIEEAIRVILDPAADTGRLGGRYFEVESGAVVSYRVRRIPLAMAVSFVAGSVSSLLGVGGGILKVPALNVWCGVLDYPQYTRPAEFRGLKVPEVLLSGDHKAISRWRQEQRQQRTRERRNDLLS